MGVYRKIKEVMEKVEFLKKDGNVSYGSTNYNYLSEEKITANVRQAMIDVGLVAFPIAMKVLHEKAVAAKNGEQHLILIEVQYQIVDVDDSSSIIVTALGEGADSLDKRIYKAMTGAYKYMQRETFAIPTGDDPDKFASDELLGRDGKDGKGAAKATGQKPAAQKPAAAAAPKAAEVKVNPEDLVCKGCDTKIDEVVAKYSLKNYEIALCRKCQPKHKEIKERLAAQAENTVTLGREDQPADDGFMVVDPNDPDLPWNK